MRKMYSKIMIGLVFLVSVLTVIGSILLPKLGGTFLQNNPDIDKMVTEVNFIHNLSQFLLLLFLVGCLLVIVEVYFYMREEVYTRKFEVVINSIIIICGLALLGIVIMPTYMISVGLLSPLLFLVSVVIFLTVCTATLIIIIIRRIIIDTTMYKIDVEHTI